MARHPSEGTAARAQAHHPQAHHHRMARPLPQGGPFSRPQGASRGAGALPGPERPPREPEAGAQGEKDPVLSPSASQTMVRRGCPSDQWRVRLHHYHGISSGFLSRGRVPDVCRGRARPMSPASSGYDQHHPSPPPPPPRRPGSHQLRSFSVSRPKVVYPTDADALQADQPRQRSLPATQPPVPAPASAPGGASVTRHGAVTSHVAPQGHGTPGD